MCEMELPNFLQFELIQEVNLKVPLFQRRLDGASVDFRVPNFLQSCVTKATGKQARQVYFLFICVVKELRHRTCAFRLTKF